MLTVALTLAVVSAALIGGALWGTYGKLSSRIEGFLIALAGGALIVSVVQEMIRPATEHLPFWGLALPVILGALLFTTLDKFIETKLRGGAGMGLLLSITLDGIPENLALGVALIGAGPLDTLALACAILLSNLPEAAGGARSMRENGLSNRRIMIMWIATTLLLTGAGVIGYFTMDQAAPETLAVIRAVAAGAVTASLATAVFPSAYKDDSYETGIAVTLGLLLAFGLAELGG